MPVTLCISLALLLAFGSHVLIKVDQQVRYALSLGAKGTLGTLFEQDERLSRLQLSILSLDMVSRCCWWCAYLQLICAIWKRFEGAKEGKKQERADATREKTFGAHTAVRARGGKRPMGKRTGEALWPR